MFGRWLGMGWLIIATGVCSAADRGGLDSLDRRMAGQAAQILVLGSVHLGELSKEYRPAALEPLLDRLEKFRPEIITVESVSGEQCDLAARHPSVYGLDFCHGATAAGKATGLDVPAAIAAANETLAHWPAEPTAAQRRHLAALFLAANDRASAYVQWLQLPEPERHGGDGLDQALVDLLTAISTRNDEGYQLGARLAARLGLQRVYPVDDHTGDSIQVQDVAAFGQALQHAWETGNAKWRRDRDREQALKQAPDLLPLYRFINRPENLRQSARVNVEAAMESDAPGRYPEVWVGGWEIRNLRMVANVRTTFRERPGARVLVIVGASHKPWFDHWLGQMQGVRIADTEAWLR